jgi:hypothetical protein
MVRITLLLCTLCLLLPAGQGHAGEHGSARDGARLKGNNKVAQHPAPLAGRWDRSGKEGTYVFLYIREGGGPLLWINKDGVPSVRWAKWVPGMEGTQFSYQAPNGDRLTFTRNIRNTEAMGLTWADGTTEVLRRTQRVNEQSPLFGTWKGDWDGSVHLVELGTTIYHIHVDKKGKLSVAEGSWVADMEGTQYVYQYSHTKKRTGTLNLKGTPKIMLAVGEKRWAMTQSYKPVTRQEGKDALKKRRRYLDGVWQRKGAGDLHLLASKREFHVAKLYQADAVMDLKARWTRSMHGVQFELIFRGETTTCSYNKRRPELLRCTDGAGNTQEWQQRESAPEGG